jgi:rhodanese-related sulfurtransferase
MKADFRKALLGFLIIGSLMGSGLAPNAVAADVPLMTIEELKAVLGDGDLVILDVRRGKDWQSSEFKIQGAVRAVPGEFDDWGSTYDKKKRIVLYCA